MRNLTIQLSGRELATVLAALRWWEEQWNDADLAELRGSLHFEDHTPLNGDEIDDLCERINTESSS